MQPIRVGQRTNHAHVRAQSHGPDTHRQPVLCPHVGCSGSAARNAKHRCAGRIAEDNNRFAFDLYARLRTGQGDNLFFSPASLSTALAMTYAGARADRRADGPGAPLPSAPGEAPSGL